MQRIIVWLCCCVAIQNYVQYVLGVAKLSAGLSAPEFSRTVMGAVSDVAAGVESTLLLHQELNRAAFTSGADTVTIASTDFVGPHLLTQNAAIQIESAGLKFLETTLSAKKMLEMDVESVAKLPGHRIIPPAISCPYDRSKWPHCDLLTRYRTFDGSCNNFDNPLWGKSFTPFERYLFPAYKDYLSEPRDRNVDGSPLPNARKISREFHLPLSQYMPDLNHLAMEYGQFLSHDIQFNALSTGYNGANLDCCDNPNRPGCYPINIPANDPFFPTNRTCINVVRSLPTPNLECTLGVREQLNQNTHFIDGSQVYGSDKITADSLRTFSGGLMKTSGNQLLPVDTNAGVAGCIVTNQNNACFRAGDARVNQQPALASMHTIWVREHNRIANKLKTFNPSYDDETLFQEARRIVIAEMQHITYNEYLPEILGNDKMVLEGLIPLSSGYFSNYNSKEKPMIRNDFMAAAFRFGHSMIYDKMPTHNGFSETSNNNLKDVFSKPDLVYTRGVTEITRGLMRGHAETVDNCMTTQVTRHLFERQHGFGGDLAAINIQRGRDHGIPSYQSWRSFCGLPGQYSHQPDIITALQNIYSSPIDMDLFTAGVSETPVPNGKVGPTFACMIGKQFRSLKEGDRFYYENSGSTSFTLDQLQQIREVKLSKVICLNTGMDQIQRNAFRNVMPGNPLVNCGTIKDIDFSVFVGNCIPINGGWSSWQNTPCFSHWQIRYRLCNNPTPNECGQPCSSPYEITIAGCWSRKRPSSSIHAFGMEVNPIIDATLSSQIESAIAGLVGTNTRNIDSSIFERAISSVGVDALSRAATHPQIAEFSNLPV